MTAYFELRKQLAELYPSPKEWRRVAQDSEANTTSIVFDAAALTAWGNILNALRIQNRLQGLVAVLERENPQLVDLAKQYVADVAHGKGAIPEMLELSNIELAATDLQPDQIKSSLNFASTLPLGLLGVVTAGTKPSIEDVDRELKGAYTTAAKATSNSQRSGTNRDLSALSDELDQARGALKTLKAKIASIETARPPSMPVQSSLPMMEPLTDFQRQQRAEAFTRDMKEYNAKLTVFDAERKSLPGLKANATAAEQHISQQALALSSLKAAAQAEARDLDNAIREARDKDLLVELDRTLDNASNALNHDPFQGFWTLLGAYCLLNSLENILAPAAATEAGRKFAATANVFDESLQSGLDQIARKSLAGPLFVAQILTQNDKTLSALTERLNTLPLAQMEQRRERAEVLLREELPAIPDSRRGETEASIEAARRQAVEGQAFVTGYIERIKQQIDQEPADLRDKVNAAVSDAGSTTEEIHQLAQKGTDALVLTKFLWDLIALGAANGNLPLFAHRLCIALPQEFSRRTGTEIDAILDHAKTSDWGLTSARDFVQAHTMSRYREAGDQIQVRLSESEGHLDKLKDAEQRAGTRYLEVVAEYRWQVYAVTFLSILPLIGAIWHTFLVNRLTPVISSARAEYIQLGNFSFKAFVLATVVAVMVTAIAAGLAFYADNYFGMSNPMYVVGAIAAYALGAVLYLINLVRFRRHQQPR